MKNLFKSFLLLAGSSLILAGCAKEVLSENNGEGSQQIVSFNVAMDNNVTKAVADSDGAAANVNRCIMEVYYGDELFTRMYAPVISKKASFTASLVSNRTYTVAFWADCVENASNEAGLIADKYYTTNAEGGLQAIALKGTYAGNADARDAFFYSADNFVVKQGGSSFDVTLKRPFSQINVITTDLQTIKPVPSLKPTDVNVEIKNAYTTFNAVTGEVSNQQNISYTASLYNFPATIGDATDATLSMDYIFAQASKEVIDIDWKAAKANNADVEHSFANVPYQRNYRTNIKGALLTTTGQWNVTVEPTWNTDATGEFDVIVLVANTISEAQALINANAGDQSVNKTIEIQVKEEISDTTELYIPDNTTTPNWIFKIEDMTATGQIVVKDQTPADNTKNYKMSAEVALPAGVSASQTTFNTPNAHGVVSGSFGRIDATTSTTTLEIKAGSTVNELYVHKGNVALYGTVGSIQRGANNTETVIVNIYDGAVWTNWATEKASAGLKPVVNLGTYTFDPTGYNVTGTKVVDNGNDTWTVSLTDEWKHFAAKEFSQISGNTITIMNAEELALFAKKINAGVNYTGYTFVLGADIDLSAHNWNPIMLAESEGEPAVTKNGTNLTIDGKSRKITGLTIDRKESFSGLFGTFFSHGTILKNIVVEKPSVKQTLDQEKAAQEVGLNYTAALIAHLGCGKVDNCSVIGGTVSGEEQVGAIAGYIADGKVSNCTIDGTAISGKNRVGGLAGKVNTDSYFQIIGNEIKATVTAEKTVGGVAGQIMGNRSDYLIQNNSIDVPGVNCPIGALRPGQSTAFTSKLEENITGNTWTSATYSEKSYVYTAAETGADDQTIWNGEPTNIWTNFAAKSFSDIDETNKIINIKTAAELALVAKTLNSGKAPGSGKYRYVYWKINLANDIDLAGHDWVPIGNTTYNYFGAFDGNGKTISNMTITNDYEYCGLFGYVHTEEYDVTKLCFGNVVFDRANVKSNYSGALVGVFVGGFSRPIDKVTVKNSKVESVKYAGAIAGENYYPITNCTVENTAVKGLRVGGIVGIFKGESITNCVIKGTTTLTRSVVEDSEVGGFTARTLDECSPTQTISGNTIYNTVKINGVAFSSTMPEEGSASPYVGSCVGRDYNNTTTCENNNIGAAN